MQKPEPAVDPIAMALRNIGATIAGIVLAYVIISGVEYLGHLYHPTNLNGTPTKQQIEAYIASAPASALLFPILGYLLGVLAGSYLAYRLGRTSRPVNSICVGALYGMGAFLLFKDISHPFWFVVATFGAIAVATWLGYVAAKRGGNRGEIIV